MTLTTTKPNNTNTPDSSNEIEPGKPKRTTLLVAAGLAALVAVAGVWYFLIREVAPAEVDSLEAATARSEAAAAAGAADAPVVDDITGTWNVDTTIGSFNDGCPDRKSVV